MSNTPKKQTAVMNRLHITAPTNSYGVGFPENKHAPLTCNARDVENCTKDYCHCVDFINSNNVRPPLPVIDHLTGDVMVGWTGEVTGPVPMERLKGSNDKWQPGVMPWDEYICKTGYEQKMVYLILTDEQPANLNQPPTEDNQTGATVSLEAVIELVGSYPHISLSSTHDLITQIRNLTGRE